jgi:hypothetical protein
MNPSVLLAIDAAWSEVRRPPGFVADVASDAELTHELREVEAYFRGRAHGDVDVADWKARHMCALPWMRAEAAVYYAQCYLRFVASNPDPDSPVLPYIEGSLLDPTFQSGLSQEQKRVIRIAVELLPKSQVGEI